MDEELVPVLGAELRQGEAHQVEDVVQEVVDGQRAHQRVKVPHHLKATSFEPWTFLSRLDLCPLRQCQGAKFSWLKHRDNLEREWPLTN